MKEKRKDVTVTVVNEDGSDGVEFTFIPKQAQASFHKDDLGQIWLQAPNLRDGRVKIKESVEDLLAQVDSIEIII